MSAAGEQGKHHRINKEGLIKVDNQEAVNIGDSEKNSVAIRVVWPDFNGGNFAVAAVRECTQDTKPARNVTFPHT